jgi:dolichol kinase
MFIVLNLILTIIIATFTIGSFALHFFQLQRMFKIFKTSSKIEKIAAKKDKIKVNGTPLMIIWDIILIGWFSWELHSVLSLTSPITRSDVLLICVLSFGICSTFLMLLSILITIKSKNQPWDELVAARIQEILDEQIDQTK